MKVTLTNLQQLKESGKTHVYLTPIRSDEIEIVPNGTQAIYVIQGNQNYWLVSSDEGELKIIL